MRPWICGMRLHLSFRTPVARDGDSALHRFCRLLDAAHLDADNSVQIQCGLSVSGFVPNDVSGIRAFGIGIAFKLYGGAMGQEIERKYLVANDGWRRHAGPGTLYVQGYLSVDPERNVRVRMAGGKAALTVKRHTASPIRDEFEYQIPAGDADRMLDSICIKPLVEKTRYVIQDGKLKWEIDEFSAENRGLIIAEVELEDVRSEIVTPHWVGEEVTDDPRYFNINLVRHPYSEWGQSRASDGISLGAQ
jgi:adenylate cyclase